MNRQILIREHSQRMYKFKQSGQKSLLRSIFDGEKLNFERFSKNFRQKLGQTVQQYSSVFKVEINYAFLKIAKKIA